VKNFIFVVAALLALAPMETRAALDDVPEQVNWPGLSDGDLLKALESKDANDLQKAQDELVRRGPKNRLALL
jgi:hypothetical protein